MLLCCIMRCGTFAGPTSASSIDYQNQKSLKRRDKTISCWVGRLHSDGLKVRFNRPLTPETGVRFPLGATIKSIRYCFISAFMRTFCVHLSNKLITLRFVSSVKCPYLFSSISTELWPIKFATSNGSTPS